MAKIKRILVFITAVMVLFTVTLAFAGCKDEEDERDLTFMVYVSASSKTELVSLTKAELTEQSGEILLLCQLKADDKKEIAVSFDDELYSYIHVRYKSNLYEDRLLSISNDFGDAIFWQYTYRTISGEVDGTVHQDTFPKRLERGVYDYKFIVDESETYYNPFTAKLTLIVE